MVVRWPPTIPAVDRRLESRHEKASPKIEGQLHAGQVYMEHESVAQLSPMRFRAGPSELACRLPALAAVPALIPTFRYTDVHLPPVACHRGGDPQPLHRRERC